ncbi:hypothetical protein BGY98DRAFT_324050 [Russula aff. rugulosa BPL654]|nr:hypothetical protein BGY98DRAFT_324050 [Russula aff. rugulosa BPL654]
MACLWALAAAALFLAGTLGSSWFAVLEALQNTAYVPTTRPAWSGTRCTSTSCGRRFRERAMQVELGDGQSGIDVGAGAGTVEGVWMSRPSASTISLVTPCTEQFSRRRVRRIHIPRTLVRYIYLPLSRPTERRVRIAVR